MMQDKIKLFDKLKSICKQDGAETYVVGGTVRDRLLGRSIKDIDLVVAGSAFSLGEKIAERLNGTFIRLFETMETARVVLRYSKIIIDITTMRNNNLLDDLRDRDFTINAMAIPLEKFPDLSAICDPTNGRSDLEKQTIRAILESNLIDDPLRLIRAVRFAAILKFEIEPATENWIRAHAHQLTKPAAERITEEFFSILAQVDSYPYILKLNDLNLLQAILPECIDLRQVAQNNYHNLNVWDHTLLAFKELEKLFNAIPKKFPDYASKIENYLDTKIMGNWTYRYLLKFTILLHDIGKKSTQSIDEKGIIHFYGHEKAGKYKASEICKRMRLSKITENFVASVVQHHLRPIILLSSSKNLTRRAFHRYFRQTEGHGIAVLLHAIADIAAIRGKPDWQERVKNSIQLANDMFAYHFQPTKPAPLLTGGDLISELGIKPGPEIGKLLRQIEEEQAEGNLKTTEDALQFAKSLWSL